jgi:hypothetical protein
MDNIIIAAIAGALGNLSSDAVKAGFNKLKELVLRNCGAESGMAKKIDELELEPNSEQLKIELKEAAAQAGADKDAELVKAAEELLAAVQAQAGGVGVSIDKLKAAELEMSRVAAEKSGTAVQIKEAEIAGKATFSDIGGCRFPKQ